MKHVYVSNPKVFNELVNQICVDILGGNPCADIRGDVVNFDLAYKLQDAVANRLGSVFGGIAGYKIAWNTPEQIAQLAPNAPAVAHVFGDFVFENATVLEKSNFRQLIVEPEIIACIGSNMTSGSFDESNVVSHISTFHAGFEIMERRDTGKDVLAHPPTIVANNVFNRGLVLGGGKAASAFDYQTCKSTASLNGEVFLDKISAAPQNPAAAVAYVANNLIKRGKHLKKGNLVLCGTHFPPFEVFAGSELSFHLDALGSVEFSFT